MYQNQCLSLYLSQKFELSYLLGCSLCSVCPTVAPEIPNFTSSSPWCAASYRLWNMKYNYLQLKPFYFYLIKLSMRQKCESLKLKNLWEISRNKMTPINGSLKCFHWWSVKVSSVLPLSRHLSKVQLALTF